MAITKQTGSNVEFDKIDPYGHSILPTFYWQVELAFQGNNVYDDIVTKTLGGSDSLFSMRCTSAEVPEAMHDIIQVDAKRFMFPEQGIIRRNGQITLTAFENNSADIMLAFNNAYNNLFSNVTGEMNNKGGEASNHNYKFSAKLRLYKNYNEHNSNNVIEFILHKALFLGLNNGGQLTTGASPDYFRPSMTIAYGNFGIKQQE